MSKGFARVSIIKILCFLVLFIFFSTLAKIPLVRSEPFLFAGATPNATKWQINLDGVFLDLPVSHVLDETAWLKYDLQGLSNGEHFVEVRAGNKWGWSKWFPLAFTKATADVIVNPYISI